MTSKEINIGSEIALDANEILPKLVQAGYAVLALAIAVGITHYGIRKMTGSSKS